VSATSEQRALWLRDGDEYPEAPHFDGPALQAAPPARRRPARQRPMVVNVLAALAGIGLGVTIALGVTAESAGSLAAPGGVATAIGRMTGLLAAYAMIVVVLLVARIPPLERAIGQDRLVAWHRSLGPWPLYLLLGHAIFITVGYARAAHDGVLHQFGQLLWTYPGILAATAGGVLLIAAGVTSYRLARRRMTYETWWSVHLYTYLALFLSFSHQVDTGASFVGHPAARMWWTALWVGTLATVVGARIGLPIWRSLRHRLRVVGVTPEGPGTVSVVMEGRSLDRLPVYGGQFFQWRFLTPGMWWQAHPYSISSVPAGDRIRITVKDLGDHSAALAKLKPGASVAVEGPYGAFTPDARAGDKVLLVGAGVGSAPILALLQDLPAHADVVVLLRASTEHELILREEIAREVARRGGRLVELPGSRREVPLDAGSLRALVADVRRRDTYVCGPEAFTESLAGSLRHAGVPADRIHFESFAF
jgi:ferredoxin-NADP reductase/DMSO/TMAO reductase YedYZ heme-binding membrane subunit